MENKKLKKLEKDKVINKGRNRKISFNDSLIL